MLLYNYPSLFSCSHDVHFADIFTNGLGLGLRVGLARFGLAGLAALRSLANLEKSVENMVYLLYLVCSAGIICSCTMFLPTTYTIGEHVHRTRRYAYWYVNYRH